MLFGLFGEAHSACPQIVSIRHRGNQQPRSGSRSRTGLLLHGGTGAGEGNRTLVCSLGSCRSTIELRPHAQRLITVSSGCQAPPSSQAGEGPLRGRSGRTMRLTLERLVVIDPVAGQSRSRVHGCRIAPRYNTSVCALANVHLLVGGIVADAFLERIGVDSTRRAVAEARDRRRLVDAGGGGSDDCPSSVR